jgi:hypothetical protein
MNFIDIKMHGTNIEKGKKINKKIKVALIWYYPQQILFNDMQIL